jgi:hypothetical protein
MVQVTYIRMNVVSDSFCRISNGSGNIHQNVDVLDTFSRISDDSGSIHQNV